MISALNPPAVPIQHIDQRVCLHDISWEGYEAFLAMRGDQAGARVTYLQGELELMSPSINHELFKKMLARLVEAYAEERNIELNGYGSLDFAATSFADFENALRTKCYRDYYGPRTPLSRPARSGLGRSGLHPASASGLIVKIVEAVKTAACRSPFFCGLLMKEAWTQRYSTCPAISAESST